MNKTSYGIMKSLRGIRKWCTSFELYHVRYPSRHCGRKHKRLLNRRNTFKQNIHTNTLISRTTNKIDQLAAHNAIFYVQGFAILLRPRDKIGYDIALKSLEGQADIKSNFFRLAEGTKDDWRTLGMLKENKGQKARRLWVNPPPPPPEAREVYKLGRKWVKFGMWAVVS